MAGVDESIRSVKSLKSVRSKLSKTLRASRSECIEPKIPTFEEILPLAVLKYNCPYSVHVNKEYQQDEFYQQLKVPEKSIKYKKIAVTVPSSFPVSEVDVDTKMTPPPSEVSIDEEALVVISCYDNANNLMEIKLNRMSCVVPRSLIQIIGLLASSYDYLCKITLNRCRINSTIIYELTKMVYTGYITDICLDGSPVREGNYYILLDHKGARVKYLSLSRCKINDEACKEIAMRLHFLCPAEKTVALLNLSSNHITDEGAKYLGGALRTNRHLRYLNLAGNRIGDDGTRAILDVLVEFRLSNDENMNRKRRLVAYLREKDMLITKYLSECDPKSSDENSQISRKTGKRKRNSATSLKNKGNFKKDFKKEKFTPGEYYLAKAELFANEMMGSFKDPFNANSIIIKEDNICYCFGNMVLCYLNLSYNHLGYLSVKKLLAVLQYQRIAKKHPQVGLIKLVIEGNPMPTTCLEYQNLNELTRLGKMMQQFGGRSSISNQRRKPTRISLVPTYSSPGRSE